MALFAVLLLPPGAVSAQWQMHDWDSARFEPVDTTTTFSLALPGQPAALGNPVLVVPQRQVGRHATPTPYILGGMAIGAFGGGVIGYAACIAGDGDCSAVWRMAAGTAMGAFLGAVFWLASAPTP